MAKRGVDLFLSKGALGFGIGSLLAVLLAGPFGLIITLAAILLAIYDLSRSSRARTSKERNEDIAGLVFAVLSIILWLLVYT